MKIKNYLKFITESSNQKRAVVITGNGFQDRELIEPVNALKKTGVQVDVCGIELGEIQAYNNNTKFTIDKLIGDVIPQDYDILILPGGKAPLSLKENLSVINFVKDFNQTKKPIAAICHGPLILAAADIVSGKQMTCYEDAVSELTTSGANFKDESVVVDENFITSRNPGDIPNFISELLQSIS